MAPRKNKAGPNPPARTNAAGTKPASNRRIAWCITGAGHFLPESIRMIRQLAKRKQITLVVSSSGEAALKAYHLAESLSGLSVLREQVSGSQYLSSSLMWTGHFDSVIISPATANTVAKIRFGIADSLVSNIAAQAQKNRIPVYVLPTDLLPVQDTVLPSGKKAKIYATEQDMGNAKALAKRKFIKLMRSPAELARAVESL